MSAFDVNDDHIRYLLAAGHQFTRHGNGSDISETISLGVMLRNANTQSMNARYPNNNGTPVDTFDVTYTDRDMIAVTAIQTLSAIQCFDYQACESSDWDGSPADVWLQKLRIKAIHALPDYDACWWECPETPRSAAVRLA